jgi:hypothetical protein
MATPPSTSPLPPEPTPAVVITLLLSVPAPPERPDPRPPRRPGAELPPVSQLQRYLDLSG